MRNGAKVCPRECPGRSAECRLNCPDWKAFEGEKKIEYEKREAAYHGYYVSQRRESNSRKYEREQLKRRK